MTDTPTQPYSDEEEAQAFRRAIAEYWNTANDGPQSFFWRAGIAWERARASTEIARLKGYKPHPQRDIT